MINYALQLKDGNEVLGFGFSEQDIEVLQNGGTLQLDLGSVSVGLWRKELDGKRSFIQPRNSTVVFSLANSREDVSKLIGVEIPSLGEIEKQKQAL